MAHKRLLLCFTLATEVYPLMRDMNFTVVPPFLARITKECMQDKEQLANVASKDPAVLRALLRQATLMEALTVRMFSPYVTQYKHEHK